MEVKSFVIACKNYFGLREGQTLVQFNEEVKQLTPEDRTEMAPLLAKELGYEVRA